MKDLLQQGLWVGIWQGSLLILLVWGVTKLVQMPARLAYVLWWLASLKLILSIALPGAISLPVLPPSTEAISAPISVPAEAPSPEALPASSASVAPAAAAPFDWVQALLVIWALGVVAQIGLFVRGWLRFNRMKKNAADLTDSLLGGVMRRIAAEMGLARAPGLYMSPEVKSPLVFGPLRPAVIVPKDFEELAEDEIHLALAHELAHIRRNDLLMGVVPTLARALFFFLPPAWFAYREWETQREAACDLEAIEHTGAKASRYGGLLIKLVSSDSTGAVTAALGATASFHTLKRRLSLMKNIEMHPRGVRLGAVSVIVAAAACLTWSVEAKAPQAAQNLLSNSSLETDASGWVQGNAIPGVTYARSSTESHTGQGSLMISKSENRYFPIAQWSQKIAYNGTAQFLTVSAWVKASGMTKATLDVQFTPGTAPPSDASHEWVAYIGAENAGDPPADHGWKEYKGTVVIPKGTGEITIALQVYGPGTIWFDDISASYAIADAPRTVDPEESASFTGKNLVSNGDFELGGNPPARWASATLPPNTSIQESVIEIDRSVFKSGRSSLKLSKTQDRYFPVKMIRQPIDIAGKSKVKVSAWVRAYDTSKVTIAVILAGSGGEESTEWGAYIGSNGNGSPNATHDWKKYEQIISIPPGTTGASVAIQIYGPGTTWIDDLEVQAQ